MVGAWTNVALTIAVVLVFFSPVLGQAPTYYDTAAIRITAASADATIKVNDPLLLRLTIVNASSREFKFDTPFEVEKGGVHIYVRRPESSLFEHVIVPGQGHYDALPGRGMPFAAGATYSSLEVVWIDASQHAIFDRPGVYEVSVRLEAVSREKTAFKAVAAPLRIVVEPAGPFHVEASAKLLTSLAPAIVRFRLPQKLESVVPMQEGLERSSTLGLLKAIQSGISASEDSALLPQAHALALPATAVSPDVYNEVARILVADRLFRRQKLDAAQRILDPVGRNSRRAIRLESFINGERKKAAKNGSNSG